MPIEFSCEKCQTSMRAPDGTVGKQVRCPTCSHIMMIPATNAGIDLTKPDEPEILPGNPFAESTNPYARDMGTPPHNPYASSAYSGGTAENSRRIAQSKLQTPAILMLIVAVITSLASLLVLFGAALEAPNPAAPEDIVAVVIFAIYLVVSLLALWGSICMLRFQNYTLSIVGCVCGILTGLGCCFLPAGASIWALVVLLNDDVKRYFES